MEKLQLNRKEKDAPKKTPWWLLLAVLMLLLLGVIAAWQLMERAPQGVQPIPSEDESVEIMRHQPEEIDRISVTLRSGETWAVTRQSDGTLLTDSGFAVGERRATLLQNALSVIGATQVLAEADWEAQQEEYGLDNPKAVVSVTYVDGQRAELAIGNASAEYEDESYYYLTVRGDGRLLALDSGTAEDLLLEEALLRQVVQPVLHKARMDRVEIVLPDTVMRWVLDGDIAEGDAQDRWFLESPIRYPAEGETIARLRENIANLRLGAFVCEASAEARTTYGFDSPRMVLTVHQASGLIGREDADGAFQPMEYPESTFCLMVGGAQSEVVDYVLYEGSIYLTSHFSVDTLMTMQPMDTLTRYPVRTALSNLQWMQIDGPQGSERYELRREERVAEDNSLVTDENGQVVVDLSCTYQGKEIPYAAFEAMYQRLMLVTVSGSLPVGWTSEAQPHTVITFETVTGISHTIALTDFDALHDAVTVDGCSAFYLIKGGLKLSMADGEESRYATESKD